MKVKYRVIIVLILSLIIWKTVHNFYFNPTKNEPQPVISEMDEDGSSGKIKISVYYEALCSDSRFFILKQLVPAYETIPDYIDLDLVPYGKAKTFEDNGKITFKCQHSGLECFANKIHACGIHYISDSYLQLKYVACMINDNLIPAAAGEKCAEEMGIDYAPIIKCAENDEGSILLREFGLKTQSLNPPVSFIPTIELNGSQKIPLTLLLKDLLKELCGLITMKPSPCV